MRFRVLGSLEAVHEGEHVPLSGMKAKALALLLLERGRWIPAQRFTAFLWDEEPPSTAVRQVQNTVAALRRLLAARGGDPIERSGHGYRLVCEDVDLVHFERGVAAGREAMRAGAAEAAAERFERALGQWRGAAFADLSGDRLAAAAARLERERTAAVEALNEADLAAGRSEAVITRARELLDADPYHQRAAAQYMHALHARGRGPEALEFYTLTRVRMAEDLGLDPGPELREAQRRVLETDAPPRPPAAAPRAAAVPSQLPAAVDGFRGRAAALAALDGLTADEPEATRIAVVTGAGGVGKTALAVEWAHRAASRFGDGRLYVDLRGFHPGGAALDPADALAGFLTALGVNAPSLPRGLEARADLYRSLMDERRMLVVLDNARDAEQVRPLLPGAPRCAVVVTSRRLMPGLAARHGARQIRLDALDRDSARDLLAARLGEARVAAEPEAVDRILDSCSGLALALAIVAARAAAQPRFPLRLVAEQLRAADGALDALATGDPLGDVRAACSWSYEALRPEAARLFALTGLHPGPDLSAAAAASLAGEPLRKARALLRELTDVHLLTERLPGRYAAHDLLAAYAREAAEEREGPERAAAERRMLGHYTGSAHRASIAVDRFRDPLPMPEPAPGALVETFAGPDAATAWVLAELPVLDNLARWTEAAGADADTAALAWAIAEPLHRIGNWDVGVSTQRRALRAARRSADRPRERAAHVDLATFLFSCAEFEEAERHLHRARALCDPDRDPGPLARVHQRFAVVLNEVGRFEEALEHCREAYRLCLETGDDAGQAKALNGIGWLQAKLGRFDEGLEHCRKSLALAEVIEAHDAQTSALDSLGYILHRQGRGPEAVDAYRRAVDLSRRVGFRYNEAEACDHLGDLHRALDDPAAAREAWRRAHAIFAEVREFRAAQVRAKLGELEATGGLRWSRGGR
ncbi:MAG TPA: BTAD domain-containing putative transcriptional regulator [Glycomyces sp.]|nr:BTAD domain-containing putative transcriptional regulator [Glycomyces sp.]